MRSEQNTKHNETGVKKFAPRPGEGDTVYERLWGAMGIYRPLWWLGGGPPGPTYSDGVASRRA